MFADDAGDADGAGDGDNDFFLQANVKSIDVSKFASDMIVEHQFKNGEHTQNFKSYKPLFVVVDEIQRDVCDLLYFCVSLAKQIEASG